MKKTTLLGIGIILLLAINIATLGYLYFNSPSHPHRPKQPKEVIIEMLHLDGKQQAEYEKQIAWHRAEISQLDGRIRSNKEALYQLLATQEQSGKDSLITVIAGLQKQIEETHYRHFSDIRSICRPEQDVYYRQLVTELPRLFGPPPRRHRE